MGARSSAPEVWSQRVRRERRSACGPVMPHARQVALCQSVPWNSRRQSAVRLAVLSYRPAGFAARARPFSTFKANKWFVCRCFQKHRNRVGPGDRGVARASELVPNCASLGGFFGRAERKKGHIRTNWCEFSKIRQVVPQSAGGRVRIAVLPDMRVPRARADPGWPWAGGLLFSVGWAVSQGVTADFAGT